MHGCPILGPALSWLILSIALCFGEERKFGARLEELIGSHAELQGTGTQATSSLQQAYRDHTIPRLIHQTWKDHSIPDLYKSWSASWSKVHPSWLRVTWSDEENLRLVLNHYHTFLPAYLGLPANISRADAVRPLILHRYGGVYVDLDAQALRPLDPLLVGKEVVVARMGEQPDFQHSIPNAFMAARPGENFLLFFAKHIKKMQTSLVSRRLHPSPEQIAGPVALKIAVDDYLRRKHGSKITILPSGAMYPVDWSAKKHGLVPAVCNWGGNPKEFDAETCISAHHPEAYSVQWWTHSWQ